MNETTDTGKTEREEKQKRKGFKWTKGRNACTPIAEKMIWMKVCQKLQIRRSQKGDVGVF